MSENNIGSILHLNNSIFGNSDIYVYNDYIYINSIQKGIFWDEKVCLEIAKHITDDSVVLDIGANIGYVSLALQQIVKDKNFEIHTFECDTTNFQLLKYNTKNYSNIHNYCIGLSDELKVCEMSINNQNYGCNFIHKSIDKNGSIENFKYEHAELPHKVENNNVHILTIPLDSISESIFRDKKISVMKIDVEGFEYFVLKGAKNTIQKYSPVIIVEIFDSNLQKVVDFMSSIGYTKYKHLINEDYIFF